MMEFNFLSYSTTQIKVSTCIPNHFLASWNTKSIYHVSLIRTLEPGYKAGANKALLFCLVKIKLLSNRFSAQADTKVSRIVQLFSSKSILNT